MKQVIKFFKELYAFLLGKVAIAYVVSKAFLKDPLDWRKQLQEEYKPYEMFISARKDAIAQYGYNEYVLFILKETLKKTKNTFKLGGGNTILVRSYRIDETNGQMVFNGLEHIRASLEFVEGMCGISNNKQADMRKALDGLSFQMSNRKKELKTSTVVPFYGKGNEENPYVLINDEHLLSFQELSNLIPGGKNA